VPIPIAESLKVSVCGQSFDGIANSNPT
jgi:hypothetical protein